VLTGKVVLVTGAGQGIGAEIAKLAARYGASVMINDAGVSLAGDGERTGLAQGLAHQIVEAGGKAAASGRSVAAWDEAQAIVQDTLDAFGRIDVVVNNAGIVRDTIFHKMSPEDFDAVDAVNLRGVFYVSRAAAPLFKAQQSGCFVHMTSTSGLIGNFGQANYGAAKMGVAGLTSNAVAPFAWTRMVASIPDTPENQHRLEVNRGLRPEKIAPFVLALASEAGRSVTGQIFGVRNNEIYLFSQPRPIRTAHTAEGWTPETIIERVLPAFRASFHPLERSSDVFTWDPV
jgi:NAD(P)-dependent dehydrogenase (short-subunit alcohol dehydrogenase family)